MPYAKKIFSIAVLFNVVLTFEYAVQILVQFYSVYPSWRPFPPFIVDGSVFWAIIPVAIITSFPAVSIGQTKCGRLWFHHYVYGLVVAVISTVALIFFASISLIDVFTKYITDLNVNVGRFFVLGGITLVLDDLPDVSGNAKRILNYLKSKAYRNRKTLHALQLVVGIVSLYFCLAVTAHLLIYPQAFTLANSILVGTLLVTSLTAVATVQRKTWLNLRPPTTS